MLPQAYEEVLMRGEYGNGKWWGSVIQSYDTMKRALKGQGLEQNLSTRCSCEMGRLTPDISLVRCRV
jgi:hypothetical protein